MATNSKYLPAEERRAMAVKAVLDLAAVQNPSEISTTAIAAHMGLSQGGIFRHFSSKEEIWRTVMTWVAEELYFRVSRAAETVSSPVCALREMFMTHVAFAVEYPGVPRIMFGELQKPESTSAKMALVSLLHRYRELLVLKLEQGKAAGEVDAELDTAVAAPLFIGAIQGLIIRAMLCGDMSIITEGADQTFEIFRRAIRTTE